MKKLLPLFISLICLQAAALAHQADSLKHARDTSKLAATPLVTDSSKAKTKQADSIASHPDTAKQAVIVMKKDSTLGVVMVNAADNAKQATQNSGKRWVYTLAPVDYSAAVAPAPEPVDNNPLVTSGVQMDSLRQVAVQEQIEKENLRKLILRNEQIKLAQVLKINDLDSLKQQLKITTIDTIKALLYTRIAAKYMGFDTIGSTDKQAHYENLVINYTLQAIHQYSMYDDSVGLRDSYATLSRAYYAQGKITEAKWFILQANALSRARRDTPNIISSLLSLAAIKSDIQDYDLAKSDLDEAMRLSIENHTPKTQVQILKQYALFYSDQKDYNKEEIVLKRRTALIDSMQRSEEAEAGRLAALKKRQDSLNKKKQYLASLKKSSKNPSQPKLATIQQ